MSKQILLATLLVSSFLFAAGTIQVKPAAATHITSTKLFTVFSGFNASRPSGANPLLIVLSSTSLLIGQPRRAPSFTINLENSELATHNFAIYRQGEAPTQCCAMDPDALDRTANVNSNNPTTSKSFSLVTGIYEYYCEFHVSTMHGQIHAINPDTDRDSDVDIDDLIGTYLNQFTTNTAAYDIDLDVDVDIDDLIIVFIHQFI